ncbi:MAG: hypothetical protein IPM96_04530 [Ignavibacteria bacterium]|nr:hypothetical protein [Ignavibacteria bacterium]
MEKLLNKQSKGLSYSIERKSDKLQLTAKPSKPLSGKEREEFDKKHVKVDIYFFDEQLLDEIQKLNIQRAKELELHSIR